MVTIILIPVIWALIIFFINLLFVMQCLPTCRTCGKPWHHRFNSLNLATYHFLYEFILCNSVPYYFVTILRTGIKQSHPSLWINFIIHFFFFFFFFFLRAYYQGAIVLQQLLLGIFSSFLVSSGCLLHMRSCDFTFHTVNPVIVSTLIITQPCAIENIC